MYGVEEAEQAGTPPNVAQPSAERNICERGIKSSFSMASICATPRRVPESASTNHGPGKRDLVPLSRGNQPSVGKHIAFF